MMDAGVPIKRPVAGIAMGLILEGDRVALALAGDVDQGDGGVMADVGIAGFLDAQREAAAAHKRYPFTDW